MSTALRHLRHSLRLLRRYPGFAAIAILTLALGIGANTAIFTVVHSTFLKALPFAEPDQLLLMHLHPAGQPETFVELTYPDYRERSE